jgi:CRISPR-associated protein Csy2
MTGQSANGLLVLPKIRVQNANCISSPLTWGFPSITAFMGFMWALERKLCESYAKDIDCWYPDLDTPRKERPPLIFLGVGVICHDFAPQVNQSDFITTFNLTRNPLDKDGSVKAIAEEGRANLTITLVFEVAGDAINKPAETRSQIAKLISDTAERMRISGGTVVTNSSRTRQQPELIKLESNPEKRDQQFRKLRRRWLPGSALVLRQDLLDSRYSDMVAERADATRVDAWLDLSRLNSRAKAETNDGSESVEWQIEKKTGWIVPIPIGYQALSELHAPGTVRNSRDTTTPFRFVESAYSIGEWIGIHRFSCAEQFLWYADQDAIASGNYFCKNDYVAFQQPR